MSVMLTKFESKSNRVKGTLYEIVFAQRYPNIHFVSIRTRIPPHTTFAGGIFAQWECTTLELSNGRFGGQI